MEGVVGFLKSGCYDECLSARVGESQDTVSSYHLSLSPFEHSLARASASVLTCWPTIAQPKPRVARLPNLCPLGTLFGDTERDRDTKVLG